MILLVDRTPVKHTTIEMCDVFYNCVSTTDNVFSTFDQHPKYYFIIILFTFGVCKSKRIYIC